MLNIAEVPLTGGRCAIVDESDLALLSLFRWQLVANDRRSHVYASTQVRSGAGGTSVRMHRLIMSAGPGMVVDHRDGDTLNNRRSNLRVCTASENSCNRHAVWSGSGLKGAFFHRSSGLWRSSIVVRHETHYLGYFKTAEEAHAAYCAAALRLHGEFANFGRSR